MNANSRRDYGEALQDLASGTGVEHEVDGLHVIGASGAVATRPREKDRDEAVAVAWVLRRQGVDPSELRRILRG
jgi:hypothetical protein